MRRGRVLSAVSNGNARCPENMSEGKPVFPGTSFISKEAGLPLKCLGMCLLRTGEGDVRKKSMSSSGDFKQFIDS